MDSEDQACETAVKYFTDGYNCAQSVLLALSGHWGFKSEVIPKIATGFGGGIGRCGSVCGALTGGVMALSLKYGTNESSLGKRTKTYNLVNSLYRQFEQKHGSVLCRRLIDLDLSDSQQREKASKDRIFETKCQNFIRTIISVSLNIAGREHVRSSC